MWRMVNTTKRTVSVEALKYFEEKCGECKYFTEECQCGDFSVAHGTVSVGGGKENWWYYYSRNGNLFVGFVVCR